jgi:ubiquinone biosynthesis protein COQ9
MDEQDPKDSILNAALGHVPFEGWSATTLKAAIAESGVAEGLAHALFPRGAVDLALAYHRRGDVQMVEELAQADLSAMRFRDRIAHAVRLRLELAGDKELVRRGTTFFSLPTHAIECTKAIWGTADAIWRALGDTSDDVNWYTKRATLSGVYGATVLFWLGDDSPGHENTWDFLDRRIEDVMRIETAKAKFRDNAFVKAVNPLRIFAGIRSPRKPSDLPGGFHSPQPPTDGM